MGKELLLEIGTEEIPPLFYPKRSRIWKRSSERSLRRAASSMVESKRWGRPGGSY